MAIINNELRGDLSKSDMRRWKRLSAQYKTMAEQEKLRREQDMRFFKTIFVALFLTAIAVILKAFL